MTYTRFSCIRQGPREEARGGMGRLEAGVKQGKGVAEGGARKPVSVRAGI